MIKFLIINIEIKITSRISTYRGKHKMVLIPDKLIAQSTVVVYTVVVHMISCMASWVCLYLHVPKTELGGVADESWNESVGQVGIVFTLNFMHHVRTGTTDQLVSGGFQPRVCTLATSFEFNQCLTLIS